MGRHLEKLNEFQTRLYLSCQIKYFAYWIKCYEQENNL